MLAYLTNYKLFIRTIIGILVLTILDGYIVSPLVYKKSNKIVGIKLSMCYVDEIKDKL